MNTSTILSLLKNSGFHGLRADAEFIYMEDPSCILRSFETFINYAWIIIVAITGFLLAGWAISKIWGGKTNLVENFKSLVLIFGILSAAYPIIETIYGDKLFANGCKTISISIAETNKILDARKDKLAKWNQFDLYENISIYDSGVQYTDNTPIHETTFADAPIYGAGTPADLTDAVNTNTTKQPVYANSLSTKAYAQDNDVIYNMPDGTRIKRSGGTRAWRNNNPGNIRMSDFSRKVGAIGEAGGFAVFPDKETGMYAIEALLRTNTYQNLTVAGAISRYAPPSENNTSAYHRTIEKHTGLSVNKPMNQLTQTELTSVANAIMIMEGWKEGNIQRI
ncbi:MAG: hypothetical protein UIH99_00710 [Alphaproteobacteria bacterium]|nr:hypothetical protein [Alphaproteobacteria bacterium]